MTGLRLLAANKGVVIAADITGKIKTLIQMIFLVFGASMWIGWIEPKHCDGVLWVVFYSSVALLTVYSGGVYFIKNRDLYLE